MRKADMPIQTIGVIILMVLVVVAVAMFFFSGLSEQGGVLSSTASGTTEGLEGKLNIGIACLPPVNCSDPNAASCSACQ